jgi:hypothetical protein
MILSLGREPQPCPEPVSNPQDPSGNADAWKMQSLATALANAFTRADLSLRVRVLRNLLRPIGPLALAALGGGVFAKYARQARWSGMPLSLEEAARVTSRQVFELVRYVEQSDPHILQQVLCDLARDATTMAALGASVDGIVIKHAARGRSGRTTALPRTYLLVREINRCGGSKQLLKTAGARTHGIQRSAEVSGAPRTIRLNVRGLVETGART